MCDEGIESSLRDFWVTPIQPVGTRLDLRGTSSRMAARVRPRDDGVVELGAAVAPQ